MNQVIIIGAGASGLACARLLQQKKIDFLILEGRNNIGGRAVSAPHKPLPVELGAEFIHGAEPIILDLLLKHRQSFIDVCDRRLFWDKDHFRELPDFWERLHRINGLLNPKLEQDRNILDFMQARFKQIPSKDRGLFRSYIEGFQAADLTLMGERGLAQVEAEPPRELNSDSQFRPGEGYSSLMQALYKDAGIKKNQILHKHVVEEIQWDSGKITVLSKKSGKRYQHQARYVVVTAPIGVLKSKLTFTPPLPDLEKALSSIHMGHVQRISFEFKSRFWESTSEKPIGFYHTSDEYYFPTWWTQMPQRTPFINSWQGGPKAYEMASWTEEERVAVALKTLGKLFGKTQSFLRKEYVGHFTHNWSKDPLSLGAYSYLGLQVGRENGLLRKIHSKRIAFAGEGTMTGADQGTVHGAMKSGERAAKQILKLLKR
ncbi:flavin monoamine oxidase family protein [Bdellovibrio sp. HCB274]|uniref:flavin monoamine oxidase family protein n=1 Tax=Bdellovibrio sp. HCB274 TaxID=3394361 RepID=UPI0039B5B713